MITSIMASFPVNFILYDNSSIMVSYFINLMVYGNISVLFISYSKELSTLYAIPLD